MFHIPNFEGSFHPFEYFFENYIRAKFHQNRRFRVGYVPLWDKESHVFSILHIFA